MAVRTWVGRFAIVQGQPQEEGPLLRSFPRRRPDEEEDELYVLVEPASPGSEEHCGPLADAIGRMFRQDILSLTGAVLRSLQSAHQQLLQWNEHSLPEHRVGAGVSCLAVRGRTAYLSQVGPAVAYHLGDGRFSRIQPEDGAIEPLGQPEHVQPHFLRYQLSPGDLLLLAPPRIQELLDDDTLRSILLRGADEALVELFRLARDQQDFSLVLLACVVEAETEEPAPTALRGEPQGEALGQPETARLPEVVPEPPQPEPLPPPPSGEAPAEEAQPLPEPPAGLAQPKVRLKGAESDIRYVRATGLRAGMNRVPPLALIALLALAVLGLLGWCLIPSALEESREERYATLVDEAQAAFDSAQAATDPAEERSQLQLADARLAEAEELRPDDPAAMALRDEVDASLNELNAVVELPELELIMDVSERVPGAVSSRDLVLGGGGAYFLEREQGRVIAATVEAPNPDPFVFFEAGQSVAGFLGPEPAGRPQHIAWAEGMEALLILDDARRLVAFVPGDVPRVLVVRGAREWGSADGIAFADGSLYVLDRQDDQVWRYLPTQFGFDSEREPLFPGSDLEEAVEIAVSDTLYLLMADGGILRVQGGEQELLSLAGIDQPLASPASLVPLRASGRLLVADRGNKRIVVLSPDGTFLQQLKSPSLTDLRSVAVDEPAGLLYILVGGSLYRTPLPP